MPPKIRRRRGKGKRERRSLAMNTGEKSGLAVLLSGLAVLLYQGAEMLTKHSDWDHFYTPPGVGEIFFTIAVALGTILSALWVDPMKIFDLIRRKP